MKDMARRLHYNPQWRNGLGVAAIFAIALWLRTDNLTHFVTADEHNWVYRSGLFLHAVLQGDWPGTSVWLTPGVTTTWLGSVGLALFYQLHQPEISRPFAEWLISFSRNKIDLQVLLYLRMTMAVFTSAMLVGVYILARKLWRFEVALLGTLLLAVEPLLLAVSRIIGHDAPVTLFMFASVLAFMVAQQATNRNGRFVGWVGLSGVMAGLAMLSKATALFLVPFAGLIVLLRWLSYREKWKKSAWMLVLWGATAWLTFALFWPAVWPNPFAQTWAFINNALLSSAGLEDADIQPYWSIPDLGYWYYLVNGAYRISPLVLPGLFSAVGVAWRTQRVRKQPWLMALQNPLPQLMIFAGLFGLFMTMGVKESPRYILPAFPALAFVAAWGWLSIIPGLKPWLVVTGISLAALGLTLFYKPYYFTYFNPLLGGGSTAQNVVRIGWGQGLDEVARWLNTQPDVAVGHLGAKYTATIFPFYRGDVSSPVSDGLDYVAFYIKQTQSGYPLPEILHYFEAQGALHRVKLNGVEYAQIYAGPAMELVEPGSDGLPLAYRPHTIYAPIGQPLTVDLLWPADEPLDRQVSLQLTGGDIRLESIAGVEELQPGVRVSTHRFEIPVDTPRDSYTLAAGGHSIGQIKARLMMIPPDFEPLSTVLNEQVKLVGIRQVRQNDVLLVDLAWQAWPQAAHDYTVFVQLLDESGERVAGVDVPPEFGFSGLDRKEVLLTHYSLPVENIAPGRYSVLVGLYYFAGEEIINVGSVVLDWGMVE